jgi:hypothetical protein
MPRNVEYGKISNFYLRGVRFILDHHLLVHRLRVICFSGTVLGIGHGKFHPDPVEVFSQSSYVSTLECMKLEQLTAS